ncbi:hypothetical protein ES703_98091 [subsurface metagenome]
MFKQRKKALEGIRGTLLSKILSAVAINKAMAMIKKMHPLFWFPSKTPFIASLTGFSVSFPASPSPNSRKEN